jgi:hypothetical protein
MLLIKEADQDGRLEQFANDIDMTLKTTGNYLTAYDGYVQRGLLPETFTDADDLSLNEIHHEIWGEVFDYTVHAQRYSGIDREGVIEAAEDLGLAGFGKAMDIAKNPRSMTAAIVGDMKAARAALGAISQRAAADPVFRREISTMGFYVPMDQPTAEADDRPVMSFWARRIIMLRDLTMSTRERAFEDPNTPAGLYDACADGVENLAATRDLMRGRGDLDNFGNEGSEVSDAS